MLHMCVAVWYSHVYLRLYSCIAFVFIVANRCRVVQCVAYVCCSVVQSCVPQTLFIVANRCRVLQFVAHVCCSVVQSCVPQTPFVPRVRAHSCGSYFAKLWSRVSATHASLYSMYMCGNMNMYVSFAEYCLFYRVISAHYHEMYDFTIIVHIVICILLCVL